MTDTKSISKASLLIMLSAILYGFLGFLGVHIISKQMSVPTMLFWRFLIAGIWISFFVVRKHLKQNIFSQLTKRSMLVIFILSAVGYAGSSELYFEAVSYTGTGLAMVIFFSYPIIVALLSWYFHRQRFSILTIITLLTMIIGLYFLKDSVAHPLNLAGIFFALASAVCYALYVFGSKRLFTITIDSDILTVMVCFSCALTFFIFSLITHQFVFPHSLNTWLYLLTLGLLATALPIQLMLEGLKHVSSMRASIISVIEPLVTIMIGILLLGETMSHSQLIGVMIVLSSALIVQFQKEL